MDTSFSGTRASTAENEEKITSKVQELMSALDQVKMYSKVSESPLTFVMLGLGPITIFLAFGFVAAFYDLVYHFAIFFRDHPFDPLMLTDSVLRLIAYYLVPVTCMLLSLFYLTRRTRLAASRQWQHLLGEGAPGALKILSDLDWISVHKEVAMAKLGYVIYAGLRLLAYWVMGFLIVGSVGDALLGNSTNLYFLFSAPYGPFSNPSFVAALWAGVGTLIVVPLQKKGLVSRYLGAFSLDTLLWELRWFAYEFQRAEFKT